MRFNWFCHLFWLIGWEVKCLFLFDLENAVDTLWWIRIHLSCTCVEIEKGRELSFKEKVSNWTHISLGIITVVSILALIGLFFKTIVNHV